MLRPMSLLETIDRRGPGSRRVEPFKSAGTRETLFLCSDSKIGNLMARFARDAMASDDVEKSLLDRHSSPGAARRGRLQHLSLQCWAGVLVALLVLVAVLAVLADHPAQPLSGSLSLIDVAQHWVPVTRAGDRVRPIPRAEAWCDPVVFGAHCTGGNRRAT